MVVGGGGEGLWVGIIGTRQRWSIVKKDTLKSM